MNDKSSGQTCSKLGESVKTCVRLSCMRFGPSCFCRPLLFKQDQYHNIAVPPHIVLCYTITGK